ncbi:MAG: alpha-L-rhamnosidase C-terminal domain-containing protein [Planctomycetota bacterium]
MANATATLVTIDRPPFSEHRTETWDGITWPASWISGSPDKAHDDVKPTSIDVLYRVRFTVTEPTSFRMHVSADERYDLKLDGVRIGRGPQRGDLRHWSFESYDVQLEAGEHRLWVWVSSPGPADYLAPMAQLTRRHGLFVAAEGLDPDTLNTGRAAWETHRIEGVTHEPSAVPDARLAGGTQRIDARKLDADALLGEGPHWQAARTTEDGRVSGPAWGELDHVRVLSPARLPAMMDAPFEGGRVRYVGTSDQPVDLATHHADEAHAWQAMLDRADHTERQVATVPPNTRRVVLIDWPDYVCAYPSVTLRDGRDAEVRLDWAETLYLRPELWSHDKPHRDAIDGLYFHGRGDTFIADGTQRTFEPVWWRAGRYTLLTVQTADEPLDIVALTLRETRYPLQTVPTAELDDAELQASLPILRRGLLMSMHEHYADSPYYEQLQYVGDTRLESLCTHVLSPDDRLPARAIELFGWSRLETGLTQSRYPSRLPQVIPGFSLYWVAMLHDLAMWRGQQEFIRTFMPAARGVIEAFVASINDDGLPRCLPGWNFLDWVPAWPEGIPPRGKAGTNAAFAWHLVDTLQRMADLEDWFHEPELAGRARRLAGSIAQACDRLFFDDQRGLYADTPEHDSFSQHAQCFAVLSGTLPTDRCATLIDRTLADPSLHQATIYFRHYLLEALAATDRDAQLHEQFALWRGLPAQGFKCPPEAPEPTRSDCHGWGSHPLYHVAANVLGVRPAGFGFAAVHFTPRLGPMRSARGTVAHPRGPIRVAYQRDGDRLHADLELPPGLTGRLNHHDQSIDLTPGHQRLRV